MQGEAPADGLTWVVEVHELSDGGDSGWRSFGELRCSVLSAPEAARQLQLRHGAARLAVREPGRATISKPGAVKRTKVAA